MTGGIASIDTTTSGSHAVVPSYLSTHLESASSFRSRVYITNVTVSILRLDFDSVGSRGWKIGGKIGEKRRSGGG